MVTLAEIRAERERRRREGEPGASDNLAGDTPAEVLLRDAAAANGGRLSLDDIRAERARRAAGGDVRRPATRGAQETPRSGGGAAPSAAGRVAEALTYRQRLESQGGYGMFENFGDAIPFGRDINAALSATGDSINEGLRRMGVRALATGAELPESPGGTDASWLERYRGYRGARDELARDFFAEHPGQSLAANVAAPIGAIGHLSRLRLVPQAAQSAPGIVRALSSTGNAAATGGVMGAAIGATAGEGDLASLEGLQERGESTAFGAGAGAALGPAAAVAQRILEPVVGPLFRAGVDAAVGDRGQRGAARELAQMFAEGQTSPEQALATIEAGAARNKPVAVLDTLGDVGEEAAAGLIHGGGPGRTRMRDFLVRRDMGEPAQAAPPAQPQPISSANRVARAAEGGRLIEVLRETDEEIRFLERNGRADGDNARLAEDLERLNADRARINAELAALRGEPVAPGAPEGQPAPAAAWSMLREGGSADRIAEDMRETLSRDGQFQTKAQVTEAKQQAAAMHYPAFRAEAPLNARNQGEIAVDFYDALLPTPAFTEAVDRAAVSAANRVDTGLRDELQSLQSAARALSSVTESLRDEPRILAEKLAPSPEAVLMIKQALDEMVLEARRTWMRDRRPLDAGTLRDLTRLSKEMRLFMERVWPDTFPQANNSFSSHAAMESAYDAGRDLKQLTQDDVVEALRDLAPAERDMFEVGARDYLIDTVMKTPDGANEVRRIFGTPDMRDKLSRVFGGDQARLNEFATRLGLENLMFAPTSRALRNSNTAANLSAVERYAGGAGSAAVSPQGAISRLANILIDRATRATRDNTNRELAGLLSETDPAAARQLIIEATSPFGRVARAIAPRAGAVAGEFADGEDPRDRRRRRHAGASASR